MIKNSTLFVILDGTEDKDEILNIEEMLDPSGIQNKYLQDVFEGVNYSPRKEIIENILKHV